MSVESAQLVSKEELIKKLNTQLQNADKFPKSHVSRIAIEHEIKAQSQYAFP